MAIKKIFKHALSHCVYIMKNGKALYFVNNKFMTEDPKEIVELAEEVKSGHPQIYIDPLEAEIDTTVQDEIIEAQRAATLAVLEKHAGQQGKQVGSANAPNAPVGQGGMSAATLLGLGNSKTRGGTSAASNTK